MPDDLITMGDTGSTGGEGFGGLPDLPQGDDNVIVEDGGYDGLEGVQRALGGSDQPGSKAQTTPKPAAPSGARVDRWKTYPEVQKKARSWNERQALKNAELRQLREERSAWQEHIGGVVESLKQAVQAARPGQAEEEIPDPITDPQGFWAFIQSKQSSALEAQVKPVLEKLSAITGRLEQADQQQAQQAEAQRQVAETRGMLDTSSQRYAQDFPELAVGHQERIASGMELLGRVFSDRLGWGEVGGSIAQTLTLQIADAAFRSGEEPAAAVDAFYSGLVEEVAEAMGEMYSAAGYQVPSFADLVWGGAGGNGNGNGAGRPQQPSPAAREMARQEQVRARSASVANARPRQPARTNGNQPPSQTASYVADMARAGQKPDWDQVMNMAKQEAGGNQPAALQIYRAATQHYDQVASR